MNITNTYNVVGMTCDHCVQSVKHEVGRIAGVGAVDVDLATGNVTVTSEDALDASDVRAAIEEAGYELTA